MKRFMEIELCGRLSSLQVLDLIIEEAAKRGIMIMLDLHSFRPDSFAQDGKWYDDAHPESMVLDMWVHKVPQLLYW